MLSKWDYGMSSKEESKVQSSSSSLSEASSLIMSVEGDENMKNLKGTIVGRP